MLEPEALRPVRARHPKRRVSEAAELEAWETLFATGFDYFGDLEFGFRPAFRPA
jgi:hypothetical protein